MTLFSEVMTEIEGFKTLHIFDITKDEFHDIKLGMPIHIKFRKVAPDEYESTVCGQVVRFKIFDEIPSYRTTHHVGAIFKGENSNNVFDYID